MHQCKERLEKIKAYTSTGKTPDDKLVQIAKLDVVLHDFMEEHALDATAIQCWTSLQQNYGCNVCTSMSMMSENMLPSACEVDVTGTLTMYAMQLASGSPAHWLTGIIIMQMMMRNAYCSIAATGPNHFYRILKSVLRLSWALQLATENTYGALGWPHTCYRHLLMEESVPMIAKEL